MGFLEGGALEGLLEEEEEDFEVVGLEIGLVRRGEEVKKDVREEGLEGGGEEAGTEEREDEGEGRGVRSSFWMLVSAKTREGDWADRGEGEQAGEEGTNCVCSFFSPPPPLPPRPLLSPFPPPSLPIPSNPGEEAWREGEREKEKSPSAGVQGRE